MKTSKKRQTASSIDVEVPAKKSRTLLKNVANVERKPKEVTKQRQPVKKNSTTNQNISEVASQQSDIAKTFLKIIKNVLERNFKDPVERLQLDTVPKCLLNLKDCAKNHSRKVAPPETTYMGNIYMVKQYILEDRYFQLNKYVSDMCGRNEFPGSQTLLSILELILTLNADNVDEDIYPLNQILGDCYANFNQILLTFPPCNLRAEYLKAFTSPMESELLGNVSGGILDVIIELLSDTIYSHNENSSDNKKSFNAGDRLNNFYLWESDQYSGTAFRNFERSVKFERIFLVLDLVLKVLEADLATWMIKYSYKTYSYMNREDRCPIICSLIYQNFDNVMVMNAKLKTIISMFVDIVALNYPKEKISIFSRLLNLAAFIINLYEYPDENITYPIYKNITLDFVKEINNAIEKSPHYSFVLYLNVLKSLKNTLTKMLLANIIFQKIDNTNRKISFQNIFEKIQKKIFLDCAEISERKIKATDLFPEKYPVYVKTHKRSSKFVIYIDEYLQFLLIFTQSINTFYRISDQSKEIQKEKLQRGKNNNTTMSLSQTSSQSQPEIPKEFNFDDKNMEDLLSKIDLNEKVQISKKNNNFRKMVHITVSSEDCSFYRSEIKYFLLLKDIIKTCSERFGGGFNEMFDYMKNF